VNQDSFHADRWTGELFRRADPEYAFREWDGDVEAWREAFRPELRRTLGLPRIAGDGVCDLRPKRLETTELYGYAREKWVIQTEAGFHVPFYLLRPDGADAPRPVVLAVHGHGQAGKETYVGRYEDEATREKIAEGERDIAVQAVRRGYAAIAPDMRGFGELADREHGDGCRTLQMHAQLFGRTLVGDRVWDVTRLLDFVEGRAGLDEERIAITGNSGGGTVSLFAAAADERIDVAVPASYFCTFEDSIASVRHCECNYVPGVLGLGELYDVAGLIAPRPFLAVNGREDEIFPIEGTRRAFDRLEEIYEAADATDRCGLYEGGGGHRYYEDGAWPFVEAHL
jgi:dienelactone hydrolase